VISRSLRREEDKHIIHDRKGNTYKSESVCVWVLPNVFRQVAAGHPFRNNLERVGSDTKKRDDVWVVQVLPHYDPLIERLWFPSAAAGSGAVG